MMLDADVVAVSLSSVWRVLHQAGRLARWKGKPSNQGKGFQQPLEPHQQWHVDMSYLNLAGTFYYLCSVLDGYSRFLVYRENSRIDDRGGSRDRLAAGLGAVPSAWPRIVSDNRPQFIARDF